MTFRLGGSHLEVLTKIALRTKGYYWTDQGPITDLVKLHRYVSDEEDFVFFVELAYECEIGVETIIEWAEEVRQEEVKKVNELRSKSELHVVGEPF